MFPQFADTVTRRRYAVQTISSTGLPIVQTPTTTAIRVSWQPGSDGSAPTGPGYTGHEQRKMWASAEVRTASEDPRIPADEIADIDGAIWRVVQADPWRGLGPLRAHWECTVELVQPLRPAQAPVPPP